MTQAKNYSAALDRAIRASDNRAAFEAFMAAGGAQRIHFKVDGDDVAEKTISKVWETPHNITFILQHTLDVLKKTEAKLLSDFQSQVATDSFVAAVDDETQKAFAVQAVL